MSGVTWDNADKQVYTTVTGTATFLDNDVRKLFVDWDDGKNQTLKDGVNQWINLEKPSNTATITHTYTQTGTFNPVLRTVNGDGFVSKYYGSSSTNSDLAPYEQVTRIDGVHIYDNDPLADIKVENKNVLSGIDNTIFEEGPKRIWIQVAPTVASGTSTDLTGATLKLEVEAVKAVPNYNTTNTDFGYETKIVTIQKSFLLNDRAGSDTPEGGTELQLTPDKLTKILKVKLLTPKLDISDTLVQEFNQLKIFLTGQGNDGLWYPITYITNGDPIKDVEDSRRIVTTDYGQSRARASNVLLEYYHFDNGKVFWQPKQQWQASTSAGPDRLYFTDATKTDDIIRKEQYTYYARPDGLKGTNYINSVSSAAAFYSGNAWLYDNTGKTDYVRNQFLINEFNQFYDYNHLVRMTTTATSTSGSSLNKFDMLFRIQPSAVGTGEEAYFVNKTASTQDMTTNAYYNKSTYPVSSSEWDVSYTNGVGSVRNASSYYIMGNTNKTNKIFINSSPYVKNLMTDLNNLESITIAGVYYLRLTNDVYGDKFSQRAEWIPLKFEDGTKVEKIYRDSSEETFTTKSSSLAKSGYITFDMPNDWSQVSVSDLSGGIFRASGAALSSNYTIGDYSKPLKALAVQPALVNTSPFKTIQLNGSSITDNLSDYTDDDIGGFKYMLQASGGSHDGEVYWVASGNISSGILYVASGTDMPSNPLGTGTPNFIIRRINVYDVFEGASKTSNTGSPPNWENTPHSAYQYTFMFKDTVGTDYELPRANVGTKFQNIYPLRIVLSGTTLNNNAAITTPPHAEIWNMLPYNSSSAQTITQKDNTAYDLNYMAVTSDISVSYAGTFYQAITKGGKVFVVRTGTPIQNITFGGTAMGDESSFSYSAEYTSYYTLRKLRRAQAYNTRVMWDEQQKDGTYVRYFGFVTNVTEKHQVTGRRATKPYTFTMVVQEICLIDEGGNLMSDIEPLGGIPDARRFK